MIKFKMNLSMTDTKNKVQNFMDYFIQVHAVERLGILDLLNGVDISKIQVLEKQINMAQSTLVPREYHLSESRFSFMCDMLLFRVNELKEIINKI